MEGIKIDGYDQRANQPNDQIVRASRLLLFYKSPESQELNYGGNPKLRSSNNVCGVALQTGATLEHMLDGDFVNFPCHLIITGTLTSTSTRLAALPCRSLKAMARAG